MCRSFCLVGLALLGLAACSDPDPACADPCGGDCCGAGETCDAATNACVSRCDCAATPERPVCLPGTTTCVACLQGAECLSGTCNADHTCAAAPVSDDCAAALTVPLVNGAATVTADTSAGVGDAMGACGGQGKDLVFAVTLDAAKDLAVLITPADEALRPVLYLRSACADETTELVDSCIEAEVAGDVVGTSFLGLAAGTYYIWVDSWGGSMGVFTMTVTTSTPAGPAANGTCAGAQALAFAGDTAHAIGDSRLGQHSGTGSCRTSSTAPELIYELTLAEDKGVDIVVTADPVTPDYFPLVYVRKTCADGTAEAEEACALSVDAGTSMSHISLERVPAGTHYIIVDGQHSIGGRFTLAVTLSEPSAGGINDTCSYPEPLSFDGSGLAQVSGTTSGMHNDTQSVGPPGGFSCGGSGPDVVYVLTLGEARKLTATLDFPTLEFGQGALYLRTICGSEVAADELGCQESLDDGLAATLVIPAVAAGTYYLWVDGLMGTNGPFTLSVQLDPP